MFPIYSNRICKAHKIAWVKCLHFVSWSFWMHFTFISFFFLVFFIISKRPGRKKTPIQIRLEMWSSISHGVHLLLLFHGSSCCRSTWEHESSVVPVIVLIGHRNVSPYCMLACSFFASFFFRSVLLSTMYFPQGSFCVHFSSLIVSKYRRTAPDHLHREYQFWFLWYQASVASLS